MTSTILTPAAILVLWTLAMLIWTPATPAPESPQAKPGVNDAADEGVNRQAPGHAPISAQSTLFYAIVPVLALAGFTAIDVVLAWVYVGLRIAGSFWPATSGRMPAWANPATLSNLCLLILALRACFSTLG